MTEESSMAEEVAIIASVYDANETARRLVSRPCVCEEHPWLPWPHDDCGGPGVIIEEGEQDGD